VKVLRVCQYQTIQELADSTDNLYFVESGAFRLYKIIEGQEVTTGIKKADEFIIGLQELLPGKPAPRKQEGIEAIEDGILLYLTGSHLRELMHNFPIFIGLFAAIMLMDAESMQTRSNRQDKRRKRTR
jgi:CRP-like cAMP-binding protein